MKSEKTLFNFDTVIKIVPMAEKKWQPHPHWHDLGTEIGDSYAS